MTEQQSVWCGRIRLGIGVAFASLCAASAYAQAPTGAVPVSVVTAEKEPVARSAEFVGRIEAPSRVEVRARVTGYLDAVLFREGERVREGDLMYRIDQAPFQAAVQQAQGALLRAQAAQTNASLQAARAEELVKTSATSFADRDRKVADRGSAQGDVVTSEANLRTAEINLGYTEIKAAISGIVSKTAVTKGNLVGPDSGVLTTIVSQDPMYVAFPVNQREFLNVKRSELLATDRKIQATIRFSDGSAYDKPAVLDFLGVTAPVRCSQCYFCMVAFPSDPLWRFLILYGAIYAGFGVQPPLSANPFLRAETPPGSSLTLVRIERIIQGCGHSLV